MERIETDYLIIGAGAMGLAFADTLLEETDARIVIVDRHGRPGGHWNDAYSFVALHQPSAYYGVNSLPLGDGRKDVDGPNAGLHELASGADVSGYFNRVMQQRLLPSGRVVYRPMSEHVGDGRIVSQLSGRETAVTVRRRTVDATWFATAVPATHTPRFEIAPDVRLIPPNGLPDLWKSRARPAAFVVLGAGKTAMDTCVWLLGAGAPADRIIWVMPRDSWLLNRRNTQPGVEFFFDTFGAQAAQMEACAAATSARDLFHRLEAAGVVMRIDPTREPSMFHYATISHGEVEMLATITNVVREGRVRRVEPDKLVFDQARVSVPEGSIFIDCTASAVEPRPSKPIFEPGLITLQMVRVPQPTFSAALLAFLEARIDDDAARNALAVPLKIPETLEDFPACVLGNMINQFSWSQHPRVRDWITQSRLDGFGKVLAAIAPDDADKRAVLKRLRAAAPAAMNNLRSLMEAAASAA